MKRKIPRSALYALGFLLFLALFRDVLANGRPLYCRIGGKAYYPGLRAVFTSSDTPYRDSVLERLRGMVGQYEVWKNPANFDVPPVYAPIPFTPGEYSMNNQARFLSPGAVQPGLSGRFVHWLGTDADGRDVAATLVSGARIALSTGALAMAVALLIGLSLGMIAGYFGDDKLRIRIGVLLFTAVGLPVAWFYAFISRAYWLQTGGNGALWTSLLIFVLIVSVFYAAGLWLGRRGWLFRRLRIPADLIIMRISELFSSIPRLILLIVLAEVLRGASGGSLWILITLIGALSWTGVAKFVRAELLRIRALEYVSAARGLGMTEWRVLWRHALPNAMRPVYVAFAFGAAGAVMLEAYLSFLGFGDQAFRGTSWGSLFVFENSAANPLDTWWVTLFPGLLIFITVLSLNTIGEALSER